MSEFVIFDTEYASWKGFIDLPIEEQKGAEIVQICAIKVSLKNLKVKEEFSIYIKPSITPKLTQHFIDLTGITDELLDKEGTDFASAYAQFKNFVKDLPCYSHGWSLAADEFADGAVFMDNLCMHNMVDNNQPDYRNIATWFKKQYQEKNIDIKKQSSGQIAKLLGIEEEIKHLNLDEHNAIYDVYSILAGLRFLRFDEFHLNNSFYSVYIASIICFNVFIGVISVICLKSPFIASS